MIKKRIFTVLVAFVVMKIAASVPVSIAAVITVIASLGVILAESALLLLELIDKALERRRGGEEK